MSGRSPSLPTLAELQSSIDGSSDVSDTSELTPLATALTLLFEHSPILISKLQPQLLELLRPKDRERPLASTDLEQPQAPVALGATRAGGAVGSYSEFVDLALSTLSGWDLAAQAAFVAGHPRIGESKNLSALSAAEQSSGRPQVAAAESGLNGSGTVSGNAANLATPTTMTPPEVLARLEELNRAYEMRYPGLRYITFVNGRSRAEVAVEMEGVLGLRRVRPGRQGSCSGSLRPLGSRGAGEEEKEEEEEEEEGVVYGMESEEWKAELRRAVRDVGLIAKSRLAALGA